MYNRYLSTARENPPREPEAAPQPGEQASAVHNEPPHEREAPPQAQPAGGILSGVGEALSGRLRNLHFDLDTLIVIIAIYFLIADSDDFDVDLLVLIGIMLVLGL
ncbi:hypothetical protein LI291_00895 [Intestinibacillus massiliensis]|nr:hypothetical protein [Intestinibacillus massiliensis]